MIVNDKILTYGPNNDVFIDQIGPFIHIYFRRTILSGPKPIKSYLSRGDILFEIFYLSDDRPEEDNYIPREHEALRQW